jgi:hypothetical protein
MAGGFDLDGRYYPREEDALNAESAQMAQIDAQLAMRKVDRAEHHLYGLLEEQHYEIMELRERIEKLEGVSK